MAVVMGFYVPKKYTYIYCLFILPVPVLFGGVFKEEMGEGYLKLELMPVDLYKPRTCR